MEAGAERGSRRAHRSAPLVSSRLAQKVIGSSLRRRTIGAWSMSAAAGDILLLWAQPKSGQNIDELWSARDKQARFGEESPEIACGASCSPPKKRRSDSASKIVRSLK